MKYRVLLAALLAAPLAAFAEGLSYNYVQLDWMASGDAEAEGPGFNTDGDADGLSLGGVFSFSDMLFVTASYADVDVDLDSGGSVDGQALSVGIGAHSNQFTGNIDLFGVLSYNDVELGSNDDSGFGIEIGARTMFTDQIEGFISFHTSDLGDGETEGFSLGGLYALNPMWSIGLEYQSGETEFEFGSTEFEVENNAWLIGLRYQL